MGKHERLRVLHVVRPAQGGIRQHVLSLLEQTGPARVQASLAAPAAFLYSLPAGLPVQETLPLEIAARFSPLTDARAALRLRVLARPFDVVHAHGLRAGWIVALSGVPFVLTAHNLAEGGFLMRPALRLIGQRARKMIAVSQAVADSLAASGVPRGKVIVIPNGISLARFSSLPARDAARRALRLSNSAFTVGCIARLSPEKGVDVLLQAALLCPDMTFLAAGDGPERQKLEMLCPPHARLLGRIADTRDLLAALDALAIPSRAEGQGIVALEAMAAGVPVVASRVGGLPEMITDGETGLLVPPDDPAALAAALRRIQSDAALRERLTDNAGCLVRARYDIKEMARAVEQVYGISG